MKGTMMDPEKQVGNYCNNNDFNRAKLYFYDVIQLRICREMTKLVTFTESIKSVENLRKHLIFEEVEKFGEGKLKKEKNDYKNFFRFTYDFNIIAEDINLRELFGSNKSSRQ